MPENNKDSHQSIKYSTQIESYSGPVPSPKLIYTYEKILPGSADRLLTMAEQRQKAEIDLALERQVAEIKLANRSSGFEYLQIALVITALIGGFLLAILNKDIYAYGILISEIAALVASFLYAKSKKR